MKVGIGSHTIFFVLVRVRRQEGFLDLENGEREGASGQAFMHHSEKQYPSIPHFC